MGPTLVLNSPRIWTADPARPWARSLTIRDGRILAVDEPAPADARLVDTGGRPVIPGLVDAHLHFVLGGEQLGQLDLSNVTSRAEFEAAIETRHRALPPDAWLLAAGWSNENWAGHELPDRTWLRAAGDRPVVCYRMDLHAALVNDAVLRDCDLETPIVGGEVVRDGGGTPTGLMVEAAAWRLINPRIPERTAPEKQAALRAAMTHAHARGVTLVGSMEYERCVRDVYEPLRDDLTMRTRITLLDRDWPLDLSYGTTFAGDDRLAVIGYKAFIDGTLGSRTARLLADYTDEPGNRGTLVELAAREVLDAWALHVAEAGFSPSMHAIGDEAARLALNAIDAIPADVAERVRPRIEHAQQIAPEDMQRFAGRVTSMQPLHKADDGRYAARRLGDDRLAGTFAFKSLRDAGAVLAFGSDWPVVACDPLRGVQAAVTGQTTDGVVFLPEQNLSVEASLVASTRDAAWALGLDDAGVLRPGALADLVVLEDDPFEHDWTASVPGVALTMVGGRTVHGQAAAMTGDAHR